MGIVGLATANDGNDDTKLATGLGFGAGAGYEFWIGEEWSLGGLLRAQYLILNTEFDSSDTTIKYGTLSPALLATISHH